MAFPTEECRGSDPSFLKPFNPVGFKHLQEPREPRTGDKGFLFRIDPRPGGNPVILVQSASKPNWDYAFHNARYLLACKPQVKPFDPKFESEQSLKFKLRVNPTVKRNGKRLGIWNENERLGWLERKGEINGFSVNKKHVRIVSEGVVTAQKKESDNSHRMKFSVACFEGILRVKEQAAFKKALESGIGSAKAFGFGLLSVAPV